MPKKRFYLGLCEKIMLAMDEFRSKMYHQGIIKNKYTNKEVQKTLANKGLRIKIINL